PEMHRGHHRLAAATTRLLLLHSRQRRLSLGQPERHVHSAVQRDRSRQLSPGLLPLASSAIQRAETEPAVGHEQSHTEFLGQGEGLAVVMFGRLNLRGLLIGGDLPEEPEGPRFVSPLLMGTGEGEGTLSKMDGLWHAAGQQIGLTQIAYSKCM